MSPKIITVLGEVKPEDLGRTLTHEHLCMQFKHFYRSPPKEITYDFKSDFQLKTIGYVKQYPYSSEKNLLLNDDPARDAVLKDLEVFKNCGGGTIVENTTEGISRNVAKLRDYSDKSGVNIVAGTGFYIADTQSAEWLQRGKEDLYNHMVKELTEGCEGSGVKAGFIGEVASVWPIKDFERKAIQAAGEVQSQIGCGVSFHPHRETQAPSEIIRLYLEAGGRADKAVMSHLDRTLLEEESLLEFAALGTYCQFDLFGTECSFYQLNAATDMPSDAQRMDKIEALIKDGKENRILMSHDIHTKHRLIEFGGHGYSHILTSILPRLKVRGVSDQVIDKITIENPAKWLTIN